MRKLVTLIFVLAAFGAVGQKKGKNKKSEEPARAFEQTPTQEVVQKPVPKDTVKTPEQLISPIVAHFIRKRNLALKWNDTATAKDALLDLVIETGNDSLAYLLAVAYYENRQFAPAVLISKDLLDMSPKNLDYLQISALGLEGLGLRDKAIPNYESMYMLSENTAVLYKIANLQYETNRMGECKANIDILLTKTDLDKLNVTVGMGENKSKEFPIKVAILNLKGLVAAQTGDKVGARKAYQDALALAPDFPLAKDNLAKLK